MYFSITRTVKSLLIEINAVELEKIERIVTTQLEIYVEALCGLCVTTAVVVVVVAVTATSFVDRPKRIFFRVCAREYAVIAAQQS